MSYPYYYPIYGGSPPPPYSPQSDDEPLHDYYDPQPYPLPEYDHALLPEYSPFPAYPELMQYPYAYTVPPPFYPPMDYAPCPCCIPMIPRDYHEEITFEAIIPIPPPGPLRTLGLPPYSPPVYIPPMDALELHLASMWMSPEMYNMAVYFSRCD